ncbi:MAG TPA: hypothetical protein VKB79_22140 [Bryobacteraceae bacterium]|nr:hypothetical protein [Bryobacteraceae bacterium]
MASHPSEIDLALFAGDDCGMVSRYFLNRHVRRCAQCAAVVAQFEAVRAEMDMPPLPDVDWDRLELEMRANIHLGLEAGECVRMAVPRRTRDARLAVAFASLAIVVSAGFLMKRAPVNDPSAHKTAEPVLESTGAGIELRNGASSLTLMNRHGAVADQTVSAEGQIRARYIDNGSVTINNVSLE